MQVHYLSPETQNEFIKECSVVVKAVILDERREAKYYAIIIDATPDSAHKEQETFILRYVQFRVEDDCYDICERFLTFVECSLKRG